MIECSIGICVYNEEKSIGRTLQSLTAQKLRKVAIDEIIVIASGTTDKSIEIVKKFLKKDRRIKLIRQKKREGKASAVNLFIKKAKNNVLVLLGGDLLLEDITIERLVGKFSNPEIGMTGSKPTPVNAIHDGLSGFAAHLLWELHHRVSLKRPKMGEVVAFRKVFARIPILSSVDEANIEPLIRGQGYIIRYVPEARIYNKAPTKIKDFIKQRRRIYSGHLAVKHEQSYEVATMDVFFILQVLSSFLKENPRPKFFLFTPAVILLEVYSRFLGWWDYQIVKKRHTIWDVAETTKDL